MTILDFIANSRVKWSIWTTNIEKTPRDFRGRKVSQSILIFCWFKIAAMWGVKAQGQGCFDFLSKFSWFSCSNLLQFENFCLLGQFSFVVILLQLFCFCFWIRCWIFELLIGPFPKFVIVSKLSGRAGQRLVYLKLCFKRLLNLHSHT